MTYYSALIRWNYETETKKSKRVNVILIGNVYYLYNQCSIHSQFTTNWFCQSISVCQILTRFFPLFIHSAVISALHRPTNPHTLTCHLLHCRGLTISNHTFRSEFLLIKSSIFAPHHLNRESLQKLLIRHAMSVLLHKNIYSLPAYALAFAKKTCPCCIMYKCIIYIMFAYLSLSLSFILPVLSLLFPSLTQPTLSLVVLTCLVLFRISY